MISETVQISLITFASGAIGAFFGYLGAKYAANSEIKKTAMDSYFEKRLEAYTLYSEKYAAYIQHYKNQPPENRDITHLVVFRDAVYRARLVSSDKTSELLSKVADELERLELQPDFQPKTFIELRKELLVSMQDDLRCFNNKKFNLR